MKWRKNSIKIIIHIADAGSHSKRFSDKSTHDSKEYENELVNLIKQCAQQKIAIFGYQISNYPKKSFKECKSIYDSKCKSIYGSKKIKTSNYEICEFEALTDESAIAKVLSDNVINHISAFMKIIK